MPIIFLDYGALFTVVDNDLKGLVTKNHIFTCGELLMMSMRESNLEDCYESKHSDM